MTQGRQRMYLRVDNIRVNINESLGLLSIGHPPLVDVEFLYEPAIKPSEDEPGCEDYVELIKVKAVGDSFFEDETKKVFLVIKHDCDLLTFLYEHNWDSLISQIKHINTRESEA